VTGCCEKGNEISGSMKCEECFYLLRYCQLPKKDWYSYYVTVTATGHNITYP